MKISPMHDSLYVLREELMLHVMDVIEGDQQKVLGMLIKHDYKEHIINHKKQLISHLLKGSIHLAVLYKLFISQSLI